MARAGLLKQRIQLQTGTENQDGVGDPIVTWATTATLWASVNPTTGREFYDANTINAEVVAEIEIRFRAALDPKQRIVHGSDIYNIEAIVNPEAGRRNIKILVSRFDSL